MTITVNDTRNEYTASAGQTVFNYTFKIFESTDLNVYQTPAGNDPDDITDLITAYTVTGEGDEDGGTIILTTPASAGDLITIVSDIPESRTTDYQNNGDFRPSVVNDDFDRVVSLVKQAVERSNRGLAFQESQQNASGFSLPTPEAGYFLRWNGALNGLENVPFTSAQPQNDSLTVTMLANITGTLNPGDWRYVLGRSFIGDGGHGVWVWDSGNNKTLCDSDPLHGVSIPLSGDDGTNGAWLRLTSSRTIDSLWWGTGSPAVQAAVDLFPGRQVQLHSDTWTTTIEIDTAGLGNASVCEFIGSGIYETIIDNQTGGPAIHITSGTGAEFAYGFYARDFSIISTGPDVGTMGIRIDGCRFATIERVRIDGMDSHGVYGLSSVGDYTDTSQIQLKHVQIENCGGYGVYPSVSGSAIQYNWNIDQCRIGLNTLGGVLLEGMTNVEITNTGVYYNTGFGLKIVTAAGGTVPKLARISKCEFDTNDGTQIDVVNCNGLKIDECYLVANILGGLTFDKGIVIGAAVVSAEIKGSYPRLNPALTGITVHEFESGCTDVVVRDTRYSGYTLSNGDMYVINEDSVVIDDLANRNQYDAGSYTAEIRDSTLAKVSATTITAYWERNGKTVTVSFRNFNNIDLSAFAGTDIIGVVLPFQCSTDSTAGACGSVILTTDSGIASGTPFPIVDSGGTLAVFMRANAGSFVTASHLTTGVSDVRSFSLSYFIN